MKTFIAFIIFAILPFSAIAQNPLLEQWGVVKSEMIQRTRVIRELTAEIGKSGKISRLDVEKVNERILQLESFLRIPDLNGNYLQNIKGVNTDLTEYVEKLYAGAEQDPGVKSSSKFLELSDALMASNKKFKAAIGHYNKLCVEANRNDLVY